MSVAADPAALVPPPAGPRHRAPEEAPRPARHRAADDGDLRVAALEDLTRRGRHAAPDDRG